MLHEEEVVVDKQAVPKERIRMDKDIETDEQQVSETLRKEQVDFDGEGRGTDRYRRQPGPARAPGSAFSRTRGSGGGARARPCRAGCCGGPRGTCG